MPGETLRLNGIDFTHSFTSIGYLVHYKKILGSNSGYMLDGSYVEDLLAIKAVITLPAMPLQEADISRLLQTVYQKSYVDVSYFYPRVQGYRTNAAIPEESEAVYRGEGGTGLIFWTGVQITLTEV